MSDELLKRSKVLEAVARSLEENEHRTVETRMIHTQEHRHLMRVVEKLPADAVVAEGGYVLQKDGKEFPCTYNREGRCARFSDKTVQSWCVFGPCPYQTPSRGDEIRAMSDEELADKLYRLYRSTADESELSDISAKWCDGGSGCIDKSGEVDCDERRHKECILRWLKGSVKCDA